MQTTNNKYYIHIAGLVIGDTKIMQFREYFFLAMVFLYVLSTICINPSGTPDFNPVFSGICVA